MSDFAREYGWIYWKGVQVLKSADALFLQQELIYRTKPDVIVETGTKFGGSACFYADLGLQVVSVDVACPKPPKQHPNVTYLTGYSTSPAVLFWVEEATAGRRTMVVLDSDHSKENVLAELEAYARFVTPDCYLIVEDLDQGGPEQALTKWFFESGAVDFIWEKHDSRAPEHGFLRRWI